MAMQTAKQTRQPHLGRGKMYVITSFLQVKQVKSSPGLLSQVPLLCECAQRALHYICNLAAWQEPREDVLQPGLTVPCLCACCVCVVKVPMADWGHKAANASSSCHIFFHSASASQPASLMLSFDIDILYVWSTSLLCPAFLALSFFLEGALKFIRTSGSCLLSAACPVFWSLSLFGKVEMDVGVW